MKRTCKEHTVKKQTAVRVFLWILIGTALLSALTVLIGGFLIKSHFESEAPMELFEGAKNRLPARFFIYRFSDRSNRIGEREELLTGVFEASNLSYTPIQEIPDTLTRAFVAIEDKRFFEHRGVDWYRTAAATVSYVLGFSDTFGASTITQQTVKNVTGKNEVTLRRKLQEILYALDLERSLEKSEILELYLNVISFSDGCIGVKNAAEYYFSKELADLTPAECASIAAITNNPSYYNPIRHPENNLYRRNLILREMHEQNYLSDTDYENAIAEQISLNVTQEKTEESIRSWYVDMVIEDVIDDLCREYGLSRAAASLWVHSGGLEIDIAMDPEIQSLAEEYYEHAIHTPSNSKGERAQSALIMMDARTGDILATVGAIGKKEGNRLQNYATQTLRSPGSAIKPISVYAPALENGLITWSSVYDDTPVSFGADQSSPWPRNATGVYRGLTNVAYAVAHSTNTVSVRILEELSKETSFDMAKNRFHLKNLVHRNGVSDCDTAALALGQLNYGITLRELVNAYTVFADRGCYHPCRSYYRVTDGEGRILLSSPDSSEIVLSEGNAAIMTKLLQGVVKYGTSSSITLDSLVECAGKTGTTQNDHDRLFVGYTPDIICGVWCGYSYPEPLSGANICTGIWNNVMTSVFSLKGGQKKFEIPQNVHSYSYCKDSGKLTDNACLYDPRGSRVETGWFVEGSEPKEVCDCHRLCYTDEENGGISHGECPDLILKKTSLIHVERHFPMQVLVSDAQYVWWGDPLKMPPNEDSTKSYFSPFLQDYCGKSHTDRPYNRSCQVHNEHLSEKESDGE